MVAAEAHAEELQPLGVTDEFGLLLIDLLGLSGWTLTVTGGFAGEGLVFTLEHPLVEHPIRRPGERLADVAVDLFVEAMRWRRYTIERPCL